MVEGRKEYSGTEAVMRVLFTKPSARRNVSLFVNSRSQRLNEVVYRLMPKSMNWRGFGLWMRAFERNRVTRRPRRARHG